MRFLADESVEARVVERLQDEGYDISYVAEVAPGGSDTEVLRRAARESRILVTNDKDFAALAFLRRQASPGIVLVRLPKYRAITKARRLLEVMREQGARLRRALTVIEAHAARRRTLPPRQ